MAFDNPSLGNDTWRFMIRGALQLLLCLSLVLVSGPLAPCKLEHALAKLSAPGSLKTSNCSAVKATTLSWQGAADRDNDCDGDGSCWCSIHMSVQDAAGATTSSMPDAIAFLTPATTDLMPVRMTACRAQSDALELPTGISAQFLPLLI